MSAAACLAGGPVPGLKPSCCPPLPPMGERLQGLVSHSAPGQQRTKARPRQMKRIEPPRASTLLPALPCLPPPACSISRGGVKGLRPRTPSGSAFVRSCASPRLHPNPPHHPTFHPRPFAAFPWAWARAWPSPPFTPSSPAPSLGSTSPPQWASSRQPATPARRWPLGCRPCSSTGWAGRCGCGGACWGKALWWQQVGAAALETTPAKVLRKSPQLAFSQLIGSR